MLSGDGGAENNIVRQCRRVGCLTTPFKNPFLMYHKVRPSSQSSSLCFCLWVSIALVMVGSYNGSSVGMTYVAMLVSLLYSSVPMMLASRPKSSVAFLLHA